MLHRWISQEGQRCLQSPDTPKIAVFFVSLFVCFPPEEPLITEGT